jgi:sugar phosphate isomerase/epimerase
VDGADRDGKNWIRPLDQGDFDVAAFLKVLRDAGYSGPIGLQGFSVAARLRIAPAANLERSMPAWRALFQN